jgi:hypothetical protein
MKKGQGKMTKHVVGMLLLGQKMVDEIDYILFLIPMPQNLFF